MDKCKLEEHDLHVSSSDGILFCLKCDYEPVESEIWKLLADRKQRIKALEGLLEESLEWLDAVCDPDSEYASSQGLAFLDKVMDVLQDTQEDK